MTGVPQLSFAQTGISCKTGPLRLPPKRVEGFVMQALEKLAHERTFCSSTLMSAMGFNFNWSLQHMH
jgi:hypothetical protein